MVYDSLFICIDAFQSFCWDTFVERDNQLFSFFVVDQPNVGRVGLSVPRSFVAELYVTKLPVGRIAMLFVGMSHLH